MVVGTVVWTGGGATVVVCTGGATVVGTVVVGAATVIDGASPAPLGGATRAPVGTDAPVDVAAGAVPPPAVPGAAEVCVPEVCAPVACAVVVRSEVAAFASDVTAFAVEATVADTLVPIASSSFATEPAWICAPCSAAGTGAVTFTSVLTLPATAAPGSATIGSTFAEVGIGASTTPGATGAVTVVVVVVVVVVLTV